MSLTIMQDAPIYRWSDRAAAERIARLNQQWADAGDEYRVEEKGGKFVIAVYSNGSFILHL